MAGSSPNPTGLLPDLNTLRSGSAQEAVASLDVGLPLTPHTSILHLQKLNVLSTEEVCAGHVEVWNVSRRNRNFLAMTSNGNNYLLKQSVTPEGKQALANEARVYKALATIKSRSLANAVPTLLDYDNDSLLVLSSKEAERSYSLNATSSGPRSLTISRALGNLIGSIHRETAAQISNPPFCELLQHRPWTFAVLPIPRVSFLRQASGAMLEALEVIQGNQQLERRIQTIGKQWKSGSLIHGDLKWDNILVASSKTNRIAKKIKIVDWEVGGLGDPRWDVATVLADYLRHWLELFPITGALNFSEVQSMAVYPLEKLHPPMNAFWNEYQKTCDTPQWQLQNSTATLIEFTATVLIQRLFEELQSQQRMNARAVIMLQLSFNLLQYPEEAFHNLLNLSDKAAE